MTPIVARAPIAEIRMEQARLRDEIILLLAAWVAGGPPPPRAAQIWGEIMELEIAIDELKAIIPDAH